jgi:hypothetical protein
MLAMERRHFLSSTFGLAAAAQTSAPANDVVIERATTSEPHKGRVLALITPHLDDGPFFACGTVAKLLKEGYTGYFIRTSNDEKDSYDLTFGETVLANERDTANFVRACGLKQAFDLGYRNHRMDDVARTEIRARLIFLFRLLKVDTVFSYDPWGALRRKSGSLRDGAGSGGGVLDVRWAPGYAGAFRRGPEASQRDRKVLLCAGAATGEPRGRYWPNRGFETGVPEIVPDDDDPLYPGSERFARSEESALTLVFGRRNGGDSRVY